MALPNPLKFEREHQIFQTEQRRSKALTFAYAYEGPFPRRSPLCEVRLFVEAHAAALISGFLLFLLIGVVALAVWRERYVRFAVRQEVLVALRELSQQRSSSEAAFQGVNSTDLFCKVLDQLAAKPLLQRVLLRGGLSERTVRSVCERLSEEPDSGVLKIEAVGGQETWRVEPPISSRVADSLSQRRSTLGSVVQTSLEPFVESLRVRMHAPPCFSPVPSRVQLLTKRRSFLRGGGGLAAFYLLLSLRGAFLSSRRVSRSRCCRPLGVASAKQGLQSGFPFLAASSLRSRWQKTAESRAFCPSTQTGDTPLRSQTGEERCFRPLPSPP